MPSILAPQHDVHQREQDDQDIENSHQYDPITLSTVRLPKNRPETNDVDTTVSTTMYIHLSTMDGPGFISSIRFGQYNKPASRKSIMLRFLQNKHLHPFRTSIITSGFCKSQRMSAEGRWVYSLQARALFRQQLVQQRFQIAVFRIFFLTHIEFVHTYISITFRGILRFK